VRQSVYICGIGEDGLTNGWAAGSRRRTVIGLDHQLGPIQKKYRRESMPGCAASIDLSWVQVTTSAEYTKSIKILLVPGRSYECGRKGAHRSSNQPVKTDEHSSFK
jgi:hypothetical protein